ncbi:ABC transporter ATP-binding protein [Gardnerella vaginalis]|uniref:ABC transporter ATP-binding protein n=1 Tax=Gardnerella vaginalis TaxID=2702 RepID=UPI002010A3BD|nr:ABC transporter ATP-binding protein [Gardnerella vaginalis]UQA78259.1 ABC transporter ATP-binding protein [Gardnerella vaginalis]UQA82000.1 ABC transporter ATP-binding protein [Gardnerella vaginalis]
MRIFKPRNLQDSHNARTLALLLAFVLYIAIIAIVMCFHEPWFDEAQSWLIARDSSLADIISVRPHYEGHPPFWNLLLAIAAKNSVPYEFGIKGIQLVCASLLGAWLIFKSPFKHASSLATFLIPFTYFACFQYGVTSRPYALLCLSLLVAAHYWNSADSKTSSACKLAISLMFMCLLSVYGIAFAAGFTIAWIWRVFSKDINKTLNFSSILHAIKATIASNLARLISWGLIAIFGAANLALAWPAKNAFATRATIDGNSTIAKCFAFIFVMPSESMFTSFYGDISMRRMPFDFLPITICTIFSLAIWAFAIRIAKRRKLLTALVIPYLVLTIVAVRYFTLHHAGLIFVFLLSVLWISHIKEPLSTKDIPAIFVKVAPTKFRFIKNKAFKINLLISIILAPSLIWNAFACVNDILFDYSPSRAVAQYISSNHLQNKRFVASWLHNDEQVDESGKVISHEENDTHQYSWLLIGANPYFSKNLIDCAYKNKTFITNESPTASQQAQELTDCAAKGEPEFFVSESSQPWYYFLALNYNISHYNAHAVSNVKTSWKAWVYESTSTIYERKAHIK